MANAFAGGALIGLASVLFLLFNGRICGVSGILGGLIGAGSGDKAWRLLFLLGLVTGGVIFSIARPETFRNDLLRSQPAILVAGLLVGFGTRLGGGCTSGHGVCGVSRLSVRSLVATGVFMAVGALVVLVVSKLGGAV